MSLYLVTGFSSREYEGRFFGTAFVVKGKSPAQGLVGAEAGSIRLFDKEVAQSLQTGLDAAGGAAVFDLALEEIQMGKDKSVIVMDAHYRPDMGYRFGLKGTEFRGANVPPPAAVKSNGAPAPAAAAARA